MLSTKPGKQSTIARYLNELLSDESLLERTLADQWHQLLALTQAPGDLIPTGYRTFQAELRIKDGHPSPDGEVALIFHVDVWPQVLEDLRAEGRTLIDELRTMVEALAVFIAGGPASECRPLRDRAISVDMNLFDGDEIFHVLDQFMDEYEFHATRPFELSLDFLKEVPASTYGKLIANKRLSTLIYLLGKDHEVLELPDEVKPLVARLALDDPTYDVDYLVDCGISKELILELINEDIARDRGHARITHSSALRPLPSAIEGEDYLVTQVIDHSTDTIIYGRRLRFLLDDSFTMSLRTDQSLLSIQEGLVRHNMAVDWVWFPGNQAATTDRDTYEYRVCGAAREIEAAFATKWDDLLKVNFGLGRITKEQYESHSLDQIKDQLNLLDQLKPVDVIYQVER